MPVVKLSSSVGASSVGANLETEKVLITNSGASSEISSSLLEVISDDIYSDEPIALFKSTRDCSVRIEGLGGESYLAIANNSDTNHQWGVGMNDNTDLQINWSNNGTINPDKNVMCLTNTGKVGIGTSDPSFPLHVVGATTGLASSSGRYFDYDDYSSLSIEFDFSDEVASIYATHMIISDTYMAVVSDERIKTEIEDVSDTIALEKVRNIPCRYYHYKDKLRRNTEKTIGFISQEVRQVFPQATHHITGYIPCFQIALQDYTWTERSLDPDDPNSKSVYDLSITQSLDPSSNEAFNRSGVYYRFYVSNDPNANDEKEIDIIGNSDNTFTFDSRYNNIFVWGKQVDDYLVLDKQKIYSLHHSAIQEIDRQQLADKVEIAALKTELALEKSKVASLESQMIDVLNRLQTLETQ